MADIDIKDFETVEGLANNDYVVLSLSGGRSAKVAVELIMSQLKPSIVNGVWYIGGQTTNVDATGADGKDGENGTDGKDGSNGKTPVFQLGTVTTLQPNATAIVQLVSGGQTSEGNPIYTMNFSLPKGEKGEDGSGAGNVFVSTNNLESGKQYVFKPSANGSANGTFEELQGGSVTEKEISDLGFTKNEGTITEVKMNGVSKGKNGVVDLGNVLTEAPKVAIVNHGTSDTTFTLTPNVLHKWGAVSALSLSLPAANTESVDFFMVEFVSGSTATTLTLPESVKFSTEVDIEPNKTYQLSIVDNLAVMGGF